MIDKNKQYKTRDGREVRIYATDAGGAYPVHGAVQVGQQWLPYRWHINGTYFSSGTEHHYDLIEVKPRIRRTLWVNMFSNSLSAIYESREQADESARFGIIHRIACVKVEIDCEEGEGLS